MNHQDRTEFYTRQKYEDTPVITPLFVFEVFLGMVGLGLFIAFLQFITWLLEYVT